MFTTLDLLAAVKYECGNCECDVSYCTPLDRTFRHAGTQPIISSVIPANLIRIGVV